MKTWKPKYLAVQEARFSPLPMMMSAWLLGPLEPGCGVVSGDELFPPDPWYILL